MNRPHPNCCRVALTTGLVIATSVCGCRNQPSAMSNPFLAPDRVPPPATRMIAPGTAQPYYPGDPLPTTQTAPPITPIALTQSESPFASLPAPAASAPTPALAFSNERAVAIPSDDDDLRFPLPTPPPADLASAAPQTPPAAATQPVPVPVAAVPGPSVVPAAYAEIGASSPAPGSMADTTFNGPWRSPQIPAAAPQSAPPLTAQPQLQPQPVGMVPAAPAVSTMPVQLRAVPTHAVEPAFSPPPRIRFAAPEPVTAQPVVIVSPVGQQAVYFGPAGGGVLQTVQVTELAPAVASAPASSATPTSPDGFRPRGSMR